MPGAGGKAIALVGFMAAGKTRGAAAIAAQLSEPWRDSDAMVADRIGEPIEAYFAREGERAFRELEESAVLEALDAGGVIALGGGALGSERVRAALERQVTVWCRVSEEVAWERARGSDRPLAADRERFGRLYAEREPLYRELATAILPRGGDETPAAAAGWIAALRSDALSRSRLAWARSASAEYPVLVGPGATESFEAGAPRPGRRLFAVADPAALAEGAALPPGTEGPLEAAGGERAKTLQEAGRILGELAEAGMRRDDALVALGGGVVGDLAGFCAAVYQRGVPVVQVPTTLVAQVDSALGGKTGVDLPQAKNYVGAFHQPAAVLADPGFLRSLPDAELAAGFAEVVKTALIAGGELWERVRSMRGPITPTGIEDVIFGCALTKLSVVAEDERDGGRRAVLNLGHTVGHAIETATGYGRYRHGEAVALGLLAALSLSELPELRAEVSGLLEGAGLPTTLDDDVDLDEVMAAIGRDKKRTASGIGFVLVREPGQVEHGVSVDEADLRAALGESAR